MTVYASADQLAAALRIAVTVKNQADLDACVAASSEEIDQYVDLLAPAVLPTPTPALVERVCVARAVEWFKSNDAAFGALGFDGTGVLTTPADGFARHARNLITWKSQFGIG